MRMFHQNGVFWLESTYNEKDTVKQAGFRWHGTCYGRCPACGAGIQRKVWWTDQLLPAQRLAQYADETAASALSARTGEVNASRAAAPPVTEGAIRVAAGRKLFPYQEAGVAYMLRRKDSLLADPPGLGKTAQAVAFFNTIDAKRIVVVCPASLKINWEREIKMWSVYDYDTQIINETSGVLRTSSERLVVIVNYDRLAHANGEGLRKALSMVQWDVLVADEAHYAKNQKSKRSQVVLGKYTRSKLVEHGLIHYAQRVLLLTGTPITNRPAEAFPLIQAVDPDGLGKNGFKFFLRYAGAVKGRWGWDFSGASNLDELQTVLRERCMVRRLKSEVLTELPPKRFQLIALEPDAATSRIISAQNTRAAAFEAEIAQLDEAQELAEAVGDEDAFRDALTTLGQRRKVAFEEMAGERRDTAVAKAPAVLEHVVDLLEQGQPKVVLFAHHKEVVSILQNGLEAAGYATVKLTGDTKMEDRQAAVDAFQTDPSVRVFIGNIQAAGVGITLTAADMAVFAELDWVPANMMQACDRIHRIGQQNPVLIQYLVFDGSLDARMGRTLIDKQEVIERALDHAVKVEQLTAPAAQPAKAAPRRKYPTPSAQIREQAGLAMRLLAGRCDGARTKDGSGFNRFDTTFGNKLAHATESRSLTDGEVWAARKIAQKYRGQLETEAEGLAALWLGHEAMQ